MDVDEYIEGYTNTLEAIFGKKGLAVKSGAK